MIVFSVIIPHYNSVRWLKKLLESIPKDERIQVIVADDKSTEDISEIEKTVIERNGIFIHNETDKKGAGTCRNLGIRAAKGKWLLFADADDFFMTGAFDTLYQYADAKEDMIFFPPVSVYRNTDKRADRHWHNYSLVNSYYRHPTEKNELFLRYKYKSPCSKMVRSKLVKVHDIAYDEVPAANDVMFSAKCGYFARSIGASDKEIYCVTSAAGTLETAHNERNFWSGVEVHKVRCGFLQEHLSRKDYRTLGLGGLPFLLSAVKKKYDYDFIKRIFLFLRENKLRICTLNEIADVFNRYRMIITARIKS